MPRAALARLFAATLCLAVVNLPAAAGADVGAGPSAAFDPIAGGLPQVGSPATNAVVPSGFQETQAFSG